MTKLQNVFKQAIRDGRPQIGLWQALASPITAEICAGAGFDWLLFDGEHGPNTIQTLLAQLQAVSAYPVHCLARPPMGEAWVIKQYLDIGFQTLLVPLVETPEQAEALVRAVRYAPSGMRGMAPGLARAARWGAVTDYLDRADSEICLLVQVETARGLANLDAIAAVDGVDGVFIGPADLSASLGHRGRPGDAEVVDAISAAIPRIVAAGKAAGILALTQELAVRWAALGCRFIGVGTDVSLLAQGASALARAAGAVGGPDDRLGY